MAAVADYNYVDAEVGMYGLYNPFFVRITSNTGGSIFKLRYRIRLTDPNANTYVFDVEPNDSSVAIINPIIILQETYFKSSFKLDGDFLVETALGNIDIEIGEVYASSATTPATFQGYDTNDTFTFYNGYELPPVVLNYRDDNWYNTAPLKLPIVKSDIQVLEDFALYLSCPTYMNVTNVGLFNFVNGTNLTSAVFAYFSTGGFPITSSTLDLTSVVTGVGYLDIEIGQTAYAGITANSADYAEVYLIYEDTEATEVESERITVTQLECQPKFDPYVLRWVNRYGGNEYQVFQMQFTEDIVARRGKIIQTDGVDYNASSFATINDITDPDFVEFGRTYDTEYTLRSYFLTQEEIDGMRELFTSQKVIMIDKDGNKFPVQMLSTSYEITRRKDGLKEVEVRLRLSRRSPNQIQ